MANLTSIATNQTVTGTWANLGSPINTLGRTFLTLGVKVTINNSKAIQFKALAIDATGNYEFPLSVSSVMKTSIHPDVRELANDTDQLQLIEWELDNNIPSVQLQVQANVVGIIPAVINNAGYGPLGYQQ